MSPPLTINHLKILNNEFYKNLNFFGRDKLFNMLRTKYGDESPRRRQISDWLKLQEVNQLYAPSKGKPKTFKSSMTTPNKILPCSNRFGKYGKVPSKRIQILIQCCRHVITIYL